MRALRDGPACFEELDDLGSELNSVVFSWFLSMDMDSREW